MKVTIETLYQFNEQQKVTFIKKDDNNKLDLESRCLITLMKPGIPQERTTLLFSNLISIQLFEIREACGFKVHFVRTTVPSSFSSTNKDALVELVNNQGRVLLKAEKVTDITPRG
jgi:hypothetical protein